MGLSGIKTLAYLVKVSRVHSSPYRKHSTKLERPSMDKHSSLFAPVISSKVGSMPYQQILDRARKACHGQTWPWPTHKLQRKNILWHWPLARHAYSSWICSLWFEQGIL